MTTDSPSPRAAPILRSTAVVGGMTWLSRVAGVPREMLMASLFGAGLAKSAFNIAFRIPNLFRRLFGEGALSAAFVPIFTEVHEREGAEAANRLANRIAGLLVAGLSIVTALGILLALALQQWWVPPESRWAAILPMLRIMLPYAPLICLAALIMGMLNALRSFAVPAFAPVFLNLAMIVAMLGVWWFLPGATTLARIRVVAWAVLAAGVIQVAAQLPELRRRGMHLGLRLDGYRDETLRRVFRNMAPVMLGASVFQINVAVDDFIAYWAAPWAPAVLGYADTIAYLPLGLFGTALGTVLLPTFSRQVARGETAAMQATIEQSVRHALLISAPAAVAMAVLALPMVELIYLHGKFTSQDAIWTMRALAAFSPGILFFSLQRVLTPAFYALKDTRTPTRVALWGVAMNLAMNILFVITWPQGWKHVGLIVSTVIVSFINCATLWRELRRQTGAPCSRAILPTVVGIGVAMLGMALAAWEAYTWLNDVLGHYIRIAKLLQLAALTGAGLCSGGVYLLLVRLLCPAALREAIADLLHRKKKDPAKDKPQGLTET
jgi:putative peptidoglycan lipid II flippase